MDTPAPDPAAAPTAEALDAAAYAAQAERSKPCAWLLMLVLIGIFTAAALSERNPFAEGQLYLTLRSDVLLTFGGRPNWSEDVVAFLTCPFIHSDVISLVFALLWLSGLARGVETQFGGLGMFGIFLASAMAASFFSAQYGPQMMIDAGAFGGIAGLIGCRLGYAVRWFGRLPRSIAVSLIVQFFFLVGFLTLMHYVVKLYANLDALPWDMLGGAIAGILLGLIVPPVVPLAHEGPELRRAVRLGFGCLCVLAAGYGQVGRWTRPASEIEELVKPQLVDVHVPALGMTFGLAPDAQMVRGNDYNYHSDDGRLSVFTRPKSPFDELSWESTRQIRNYREKRREREPETAVYIGEQREGSVVAPDGSALSYVRTTVGYERGDVHEYELWYAFLNESRLVFLIYPFEPQDSLEREWIEDSLRRFRFDEP